MTADIRRAVISHLGSGADPRFNHMYLIAKVRKQTQWTSGDVWEALWGLVGDGLVYLDTAGQGSDNWRWCLSRDGKRIAQGGTWEPRDPDGYLERIRREIPGLDELVELYLTEALQSFNGRAYLATSVMLGVAAERAFLVMAESYAASSMAGASAMARELGKARSTYFALWTEFRKRIEPVRHELPEGLADPLTLDAIADLIRQTRNEVGQETGRYRWDQLMKTEKTHFGTLFEINGQREFGFDGGAATDYRIAGHQVDAKWSQTRGGWMLPPEVFDELALVATGDDAQSVWSLGLIRVSEQARRVKGNRDQKSQLNETGRRSILWLWDNAPLRPNVLLQLPRDVVDHIFDHRYGTQRTNRLFRAAEGMIVHRNAVATVSRQLDAQKRVRYNGGAREALAPEGYLILSGFYHRGLAAALGLPIPMNDEYVSVRVVPTDDSPGVVIGDRRWRRAGENEPSIVPAPRIDE